MEASYRALRGLKGARSPSEISGWIDDPALSARRLAYTLLPASAAAPARLTKVSDADGLRFAMDRIAVLERLVTGLLRERGLSSEQIA